MTRFVVAVLTLVLWTATAAAAQPLPAIGGEIEQLRTSRHRLRAGEEVMIRGDGCAGGGEVLLELYDPDLHSSMSMNAGINGSFAQLIEVPSAVRVGRAWLRASCRTPESEITIREAVLLITRPAFFITWTNVFFGLGTMLVTAGLGWTLLRGPQGGPPARRRSTRRRRL